MSSVENLPPLLTNFIGRDHEIAAISSLLHTSRLLTLTGVGGTGKTRLAIAVASALRAEFTAGVHFIALAAITDPTLLLPAIARALDLSEAAGIAIEERLATVLADKACLVVLDNFEQIGAAASQVAALLAAAPALKILVTSRAALRVYGEQEFAVPPLQLPDPAQLPPLDQLGQYEAVRLFVTRAQAVKSDFTLTAEVARAVAEICARLDGLPLAIELAAARVRLLPPPQLLARLERRLPLLSSAAAGVPARHQTLRQTIDWSYDLLDPAEQQLFRCLAVFVGGCTLEAVEALAAAAHQDQAASALDRPGPAVSHPATTAAMEPGQVFDTLEGLIAKSLVRQEDTAGAARFTMLETVGEYAGERLAALGETARIRQHHAAYYVQFAEFAEGQLSGPQQEQWWRRLEQEHDNLRAALAWSQEPSGDPLLGLRLATALSPFWRTRGYISEGRRWLEAVLTTAHAAQVVGTGNTWVAAYNGAGVLAAFQGDYPEAVLLLERSVQLARESGDRLLTGKMLNNLGIVARRQGDYAWAEDLHNESLAISRETGDPRLIASVLTNLAAIAQVKGDLHTALDLHEQSLALKREIGFTISIPPTLEKLALVLLELGEHEQALARAQEELRIAQDIGDKSSIGSALACLASVLGARSDYSEAERLLAQSLTILREIDDWYSVGDTLSALGRLALRQGEYAQARAYLHESLQMRRKDEHDVGTADRLACLAGVEAAAAREPEAAHYVARLLGAVEAQCVRMAAPLSPSVAAERAQALAAAQQTLGPPALAAAYAEGGAMSLDQAIAFGLQGVPRATPAADTGPRPSVPAAPERAPGTLPYTGDLTPRELEVLRLLAAGLSNNEIGERLSLSTYTVQTHVRNIFSKLNVTARSAAARYAFDHGLS